jgi:hypothetical protein
MADKQPGAQLAEAEVTLATIREWAEGMHRAASAGAAYSPSGHAAGYDKAVRDVLAILDSRHAPPGEPVILPG